MMKKKFKNKPNTGHIVNGKVIWESRSPALVAVIICLYEDEDYVLLAQRGEVAADYQGLWNVPCGYLDWDENGFEGVCREVYEETGLYIPNHISYTNDSWLYQPFYVNTEITENRQNVALNYGLYFKTLELPKLSTSNCEEFEVSQVKWVRISDIGDYNLAFRHDKRIKYFYELIKK